MRFGKWRLPIIILVTAFYLATFWVVDNDTILVRKIGLGMQFTSVITAIGPRMLFAAVFIGLAFLFGRVYCSLICPAGHLQDLFTRVGSKLGIMRAGYQKNKNPALYMILATIASILGLFWLATYLDPVGLFGRFAMPIAERLRDISGESYRYEMEVILIMTMSAMLLVVVPVFIGRWFCDAFCPVGALLGACSSLSRSKRVDIDKRKCVSCGQCDKICQTHCIDAKEKRVEGERCVLCGQCLDVCQFDAISYEKREPDNRRDFMERSLTAVVGGLFVFSREIGRKWGMGLEAQITDVSPPGSGGNENHRQRCISCQSCVPTCPVGIIRSKVPHLRPVLDYDQGYCQYNCEACSQSCPTGALRPMEKGKKQLTRIAKTTFVLEACIVVRRETACGACAEVCPTHALVMVDQEDGKPSRPDFQARYCIGCGACYHVCPAEPRAFRLAGLEKHEISAGLRPGAHQAQGGGKESTPEGGLQDFPF